MLRVALTGGSRGIGLAIAARLVRDGHAVHVLARTDAAAWRQSAGELADRVTYHAGDVTDRVAAGDWLVQAAGAMGGLDVLINNAGVLAFDNTHELSPENLDRQIAVNLTAPLALSSAALKIMLAQDTGGHILNVSSVAGVKATPKLAAYGAAKAGLVHLTRCIAAEYARRKIRCNAICPGALATGLMSPAVLPFVKKAIPLGEFQRVEDVAGLVAWMLLEEAAGLTGAVVSLDGGLSL